ncbi:Sensor histidine kinase desK [Acidipropionibacterium jensenii]|uniref:histidine kinase n=2 Tax=Acidipropionibacterium jensenii TaxID=1749 RepID=A0A448P2W8_9ACTN|nr:Sensor histidine kinase desK [Acidipropionibacterium jensenii]
MSTRRRLSIRGIHNWIGRHPMVGDAVLALLLTPFALAGTISGHYGWARALWGLCYVVPLIWRRARPDVAAAGVAVACLVQLVVATGPNAGNVTVPIVIYAVIAYGNARHARWWLWLALAGSLAAGLRWSLNDDVFRSYGRQELILNITALTIGCAVTVLMAWYAGRFARERRLNLEQLRRRAEDLERERDQRVKLATQEERTRIAREMHDIVAHSLSVIVVQADGGSYLAHHDDAGDAESRLRSSATALDTIAETARTALTETRRLVGVLRDDSGRPADLTPSQGLADLPALIEETRGALPVTLQVTGDPDGHPALSAGADLACYRVVQESLTNVLKHAGPGASALVQIIHRPDRVEVRVTDDGRGSLAATDDGAGHGLVGMRERVSAWGGTLEARDRLDGGYQVDAVIPVESTPTHRTPGETP